MTTQPKSGSPESNLARINTELRSPKGLASLQNLNATNSSPEFIVSQAMFQIRNNDALQRCTPDSILKAVCQAIGLGLVPDGVLGHAFLIPYGKTCQFQPGYKGLVQLALRSQQVGPIDAQIVYSKDIFREHLGSRMEIEHRRHHGKDRGTMIGAYATAYIVASGKMAFRYLRADEIESVREGSKAVIAVRAGKLREADCPWFSDPEPMWKKTAWIRLVPWLPSSPELQKAIVADEKAEGMRPDYDIEFPEEHDVLGVPAAEPQKVIEHKYTHNGPDKANAPRPITEAEMEDSAAVDPASKDNTPSQDAAPPPSASGLFKNTPYQGGPV